MTWPQVEDRSRAAPRSNSCWSPAVQGDLWPETLKILFLVWIDDVGLLDMYWWSFMIFIIYFIIIAFSLTIFLFIFFLPFHLPSFFLPPTLPCYLGIFSHPFIFSQFPQYSQCMSSIINFLFLSFVWIHSLTLPCLTNLRVTFPLFLSRSLVLSLISNLISP